MRKPRHLMVAAAMAVMAWTTAAPAWTAPDWPEPARPGQATLDGSDTTINLDSAFATTPAGLRATTGADRDGGRGARAYEPDARGTPTMARPPTAADESNDNENMHYTVEPGRGQPRHEGRIAAMYDNHRSNATPGGCPCQTNGGRLERQERKEEPGRTRRT